jgi:hypothetical protein
MDPPKIISAMGHPQAAGAGRDSGEERAGYVEVGPDPAVEMAPYEGDPSAFRVVYGADGRADCTSCRLSLQR